MLPTCTGVLHAQIRRKGKLRRSQTVEYQLIGLPRRSVALRTRPARAAAAGWESA